jgi:hypothetical protein
LSVFSSRTWFQIELQKLVAKHKSVRQCLCRRVVAVPIPSETASSAMPPFGAVLQLQSELKVVEAEGKHARMDYAKAKATGMKARPDLKDVSACCNCGLRSRQSRAILSRLSSLAESVARPNLLF